MKVCPKCKAELPNDAKFCSNCAAPVPTLERSSGLVGKCINNKYIVTKKIAEGGMGEVYLARQQGIDQEVAIKKLHASLCQNQMLVDRFVTEARAYGRISHPNAVKVHDLLNVNGELCIIMEYVKGRTLTSLIESGYIFSQRQVIDISMQIADALATVHQAGIIHRDLKTENVMLLETVPGRFSVKILDFGIAKVADAPTDGKTTEGMLLGTPEFMSPEQCCGEKIDLRSDIYSFGIILYAMVSGRLPFKADNKLAILGQQVNLAPSQLMLRDGTPAPAGLDAVVMKCLRKKRENRYQNFADVITDVTLREEGGEPVFAKSSEARNTDASLSSPVREKGSIRASSSLELSTNVYEKVSHVELGRVEQMSIRAIDGVKLELGEKPEAEAPSLKLSPVSDEASKPVESEAFRLEAPDESKSKAVSAEVPKASGRFELGTSPDDDKEEGGKFELSVKEDKEPSLGGFSIGTCASIDDDEKEPASVKSHKGVVAFILILILAGAGAGYYFWGEHLGLRNADEVGVLSGQGVGVSEAPEAEEALEATTPLSAEARTAQLPTVSESAPAAVQPEPVRDPIPASKLVTQDVLMRGVWRSALEAVPEKLNAGELENAEKRLNEIEKSKAAFTAEDDARIAELRKTHELFKSSLDSAGRAKKNLSCGEIKKILEGVPSDAKGLRVQIEKMYRSCSSTAERPPDTL